jgi:hypothetical protein
MLRDFSLIFELLPFLIQYRISLPQSTIYHNILRPKASHVLIITLIPVEYRSKLDPRFIQYAVEALASGRL